MIDKDKVIELYKNGLSQKAIARQLGCCYQNINRILKKEGLIIPMAERKPVTFNCRQCGRFVVTNPACGDQRTVFCCRHCEKQYWRHYDKGRKY